MVRSQTLTPIEPTASRVALFAPVCDVNPYGRIQTPEELTAGCQLFSYQKNQQRAIIALHFARFSGGLRCNVNAVQTTDPQHAIQFKTIMQAIEHQAAEMGADILTLCTQHPAVAKSAPRWGGAISGVVIAKQIGGH